MRNQKNSLLIIVLLLAINLASCKTLNLTSSQNTNLSEESTVLPSLTQSISDTPDKTVTPPPASNTLPAIRKTPGVLDCADIVKAHSESTAMDWEGEKMLLRGREFFYTGSVFAVTESDAVHLTGSLCHATLHHVPHEIAVMLSHGQLIEGYGTIASISFFRGENVDIEVNPDLLFVR
jgi:hypothetical protein